jgi:hypothetical protein
MSTNIKNIPNNIYLQVDMEGDTSEVEFKDLSGVSWCADRIHDTDLKFQLNKTNNLLFTKEELIAFALFAPEFSDIKVKKAYLEEHFETWSFLRK